jgi:hypothetical protein
MTTLAESAPPFNSREPIYTQLDVLRSLKVKHELICYKHCCPAKSQLNNQQNSKTAMSAINCILKFQ